MKLYMVAFVRDNAVETIIKMTKNLNIAQYSALHAVGSSSAGKMEAEALLKDFADKRLTDNFVIKIDDDLNLQLFTWEQEI